MNKMTKPSKYQLTMIFLCLAKLVVAYVFFKALIELF